MPPVDVSATSRADGKTRLFKVVSWLCRFDWLSSEQDQPVGDCSAPASIVVCALKFLVKHLIAFDAEYVPKMTIRNQNRSALAAPVQFQRSCIEVEAYRQLRAVDEKLGHIARINVRSESVWFCWVGWRSPPIGAGLRKHVAEGFGISISRRGRGESSVAASPDGDSTRIERYILAPAHPGNQLRI